MPNKTKPRFKKRPIVTGHRSSSSAVKLIKDQKNQWRTAGRLRKLLFVFLITVFTWFSLMYGVAQWYIWKHRNEPLRIGATFIPDYARHFELDPKETMDAMINDLGIRQFRLVSYWNNIEPEEGKYDFSELDWQFEKVAQAGGKVSLAVGLRQPRWPECHAPEWLGGVDKPIWQPKLMNFMTKVIERYRNNPVLESYQLENEFFMDVFGICPDFSRERLVDEYKMMKTLDSSHPIIVSRSNNWVGLPLGDPRPDQFGISVYKRVWDKTITKRYFEYPLPAWFYASLAGGGELFTGKSMILHELQTESWLPEGYDMKTASKEELDKSLSPERLKDRIRYGVATGMKDIYLWGPEWWYFMKVKRGEPALWDTAKQELIKYR